MRRRTFLGIALILPFGGATARAQPTGRVYRVGYIQTATEEEQAHLTRAFEGALRELGYVDGRNLVIEKRFASGKQEILPQLASELVATRVDVIVTGANPVIAAVKAATSTIPIVMAASRDPVGSGFVATLNRPGTNITGLTNDPAPEVQAKRVELLKAALPRASRIAVLWNPVPPAADAYRNTVEGAGVRLGLAVRSIAVKGRDEFDGAFASMSRERVDGVIVLPDPLFFTARAQVVALATRYRLPAVFHAREFVELGGLMSYGSNLVHQFRRAAAYVDKILRGMKASELPVEQSATLELVINRKTATAFGVTVPSSLMLQADHIVD
jgi:putative ABC transport system substrate-binding protein